MPDLLIASSPVEIEAKCDALGLPAAAHDAAKHLFHDLTSRLELSSFRISADGGEEWPKHRFLFGPAAAIGTIVAALEAGHGAVDVATAAAGTANHPDALFVRGAEGEHAAVLLACPDAARLSAMTDALVPRTG